MKQVKSITGGHGSPNFGRDTADTDGHFEACWKDDHAGTTPAQVDRVILHAATAALDFVFVSYLLKDSNASSPFPLPILRVGV